MFLYNDKLSFAKQIYDAVNKKKPISVTVLDVHHLTSFADLFIIVVAPNTKQTQAISDEVEETLIRDNKYLRQKEGYDTANWILLDYDNIIVHILYKEDAEFYDLERLWKDAKRINFS